MLFLIYHNFYDERYKLLESQLIIIEQVSSTKVLKVHTIEEYFFSRRYIYIYIICIKSDV